MPAMLGRIRTVLEMIKVVVVEFQSALCTLSELGHIETMGFRTLQDSYEISFLATDSTNSLMLVRYSST